MPKALIAEMKRGHSGSGLSEKEVNHRIYGHLNNEGAMQGSKITRKGARMESKFLREHGKKHTAREAAMALRERKR